MSDQLDHSARKAEFEKKLEAYLFRRAIPRRSLLASALGLSMTSLLAACGADSAPAATSTPASTATAEPVPTATTEPATATAEAAGWTFTDDRGVEVTLDERPVRIAGFTQAIASLWDFGIRPVAMAGPRLNDVGGRDLMAGSVDFDAVEDLGDWDVDLEALVALDIDLYVDAFYFDTGEPLPVETVVPAVALLAAHAPTDELIRRWEEFAIALGVDPDAPELVEDRARFDKASDDLRQALAEKPGLRTMFFSGWPEAMYICNPQIASDLQYFASLGMDILQPDTDVFWEEASWERANEFNVDLAFYDSRDPNHDQINNQTTFTQLPAYQNDQIATWILDYPYSYRSFAGILESVAEAVRNAAVVTDRTSSRRLQPVDNAHQPMLDVAAGF